MLRIHMLGGWPAALVACFAMLLPLVLLKLMLNVGGAGEPIRNAQHGSANKAGRKMLLSSTHSLMLTRSQTIVASGLLLTALH